MKFSKKKWLFILTMVLLGTILYSQKLSVVFRFDDYGLTDTQFNEELFKVFKECKVPLVVGVTPSKEMRYPDSGIMLLDKEIQILKEYIEAGVVEVALHGYNHIDPINPQRGSSELIALPYEMQKNKLNSGKKYLENTLDINVSTFIPPFNSYNETTLKVLQDCNFDVLSAAMGTTTVNNYNLVELHCTTDLFSLKKGLMQARLSKEDKLIVCLLHDYNFMGVDRVPYLKNRKRIDFSMLKGLLEHTKDSCSEIVTFEYLKTVDSAKEYAVKNNYDLKYIAYLPGFFQNWLSPQYTSRTSQGFLVLRGLSYSLMIFYFSFVIACMTFIFIMVYKWKPNFRLLIGLQSLVFLIIVIAIHDDLQVGLKLRYLLYIELSLILTSLYITFFHLSWKKKD